jgi:hypothetical protein
MYTCYRNVIVTVFDHNHDGLEFDNKPRSISLLKNNKNDKQIRCCVVVVFLTKNDELTRSRKYCTEH